MSGQNWQVDPSKRDYVTNKGTFLPTDRIFEKAFFVVTIPRGLWLYGSVTQGSELFKFKNAKRTSDIEQLYESRMNGALKTQLVDVGEAISTQTTNLESSRYGTSNNTNITVPNKPRVAQIGFSSV